ncbi:MAG: hypothetical protein KZQ90_17210 [Candidatus Thiodiazotropha sp. (ex Codakia rugifera)]|nr:hypothetical protein [Candidatus Thiodiazotropha sp. (ex Codakia rugifera)]
MKIPRLVAHRGYSAAYPENTLISMQAAVAADACCIEFDVQMCADGNFVVMHDDKLLRTCGVDRSVFDITLADCMQISTYEVERSDKRLAPEPVPSLQQMLDFIRVYPALTAYIEIKEESLNHFSVDRVMQRLLAEVSAYATQCVIISFSAAAITYVKQHSQLRTGWVLHRYDHTHYEHAADLHPDFLICNQRKIDTQELWPGSWLWMLYGVEHAQIALDWGARGVSYIATDHIAELLAHDVLRQSACDHTTDDYNNND